MILNVLSGMVLTFHKSCVIAELLPSAVIFWTELSCSRKTYSNKATFNESFQWRNVFVAKSLWFILCWSHCNFGDNKRKFEYFCPVPFVEIYNLPTFDFSTRNILNTKCFIRYGVNIPQVMRYCIASAQCSDFLDRA
jgi:hypothetical protein